MNTNSEINTITMQEDLEKTFIDKLKSLKDEINNILLFNRSVKDRYTKLYHSELNQKEIFIHFCQKNNCIVRIIVNYSLNEDSVFEIFTDDKEVERHVLESTPYKEFVELVAALKTHNDQDRVFTKLAYGIG